AWGVLEIPRNLEANDRREATDGSEPTTRVWIEGMVENLPPDAIIAVFTKPAQWRFHAVFAHYVQTIEARRLDVSVVRVRSSSDVLALWQLGRPLFTYPPASVFKGWDLRRFGPIQQVLWPTSERPSDYRGPLSEIHPPESRGTGAAPEL